MFGRPNEDGVMFYDKVLAPHDFPFLMAIAISDSIDEGYMLNVYADDDTGIGIVELGPYDYYLYSATDVIDIIPLGNGRTFAERLLGEVLGDIARYKEEYDKYVEDADDLIAESLDMEFLAVS